MATAHRLRMRSSVQRCRPYIHAEVAPVSRPGFFATYTVSSRFRPYVELEHDEWRKYAKAIPENLFSQRLQLDAGELSPTALDLPGNGKAVEIGFVCVWACINVVDYCVVLDRIN